jgi:hypothetical protein
MSLFSFSAVNHLSPLIVCSFSSEFYTPGRLPESGGKKPYLPGF